MNKRTLFTFLLALLPLFLPAQAIHSWPDHNTVWELQLYDDFNVPMGVYQHWRLDGDTILLGQTYQKVHRYYPGIPNQNYYAATRSDSLDRVYILFKDSLNEALLYDFGAQVGDTVRDLLTFVTGAPNGYEDLVVTQKDTVTLPLLDGPHVHLSLESPNLSLNIYDGVGALNDPIHPRYLPLLGGDYYLVCFNRDSVAVMASDCSFGMGLEESGASLELWPNPVTDQLKIGYTGDLLILRTELRDLQGRLLYQWEGLPERIDLSGLPTGFYVIRIAGEGFHRTKKILKE